MMEFKVSELEKEPIEFDLQLPIGAIDYGEEATQDGPLASSGRAEVIHEHRGPREIVPDIRLKGRLEGQFEVPCARCIDPVEDSPGRRLRSDLSAYRSRCRRPRALDNSAGDRNRLLSRRQSFA